MVMKKLFISWKRFQPYCTQKKYHQIAPKAICGMYEVIKQGEYITECRLCCKEACKVFDL